MSSVEQRVILLRYSADPEEIVAFGAKLCYSPATIEELEQGIPERDQSGFVKRLMALDHLSPVEHASFTYGIEGVSRSLLAQITRHRIASFSVKSQRYVEHTGEESDGVFDYIIPPQIRELGREYVDEYGRQMGEIQKWYNFWRDKLGGAGEAVNEDARFVLPNAAETKMIVTMNARELLHFFALRCCNRAQWEIRQLATGMLRLAKGVAPAIFAEAGPPCVVGPCPEREMGCGKTAEVREKFKNL
ncbi:MAG TPA: FAD-dependent thymidylate synthase [Clostridia bacterium]|nr:FAD-dependent thymidylate synthase [Clostridia bacterium]